MLMRFIKWFMRVVIGIKPKIPEKQPLSIPQDMTGKYLEPINDFIEREFYLSMYDLLYKTPDKFAKLYNGYYSVFLMRFAGRGADDHLIPLINELISTFYTKIVTNCLIKMSPYLRESFHRVYSPKSLDNDSQNSGLVSYIMNYSEIKIQILLAELLLWRQQKQKLDNIERDEDYWGIDILADQKDPIFIKYNSLSNVELLLPRLYTLFGNNNRDMPMNTSPDVSNKFVN